MQRPRKRFQLSCSSYRAASSTARRIATRCPCLFATAPQQRLWRPSHGLAGVVRLAAVLVVPLRAAGAVRLWQQIFSPFGCSRRRCAKAFPRATAAHRGLLAGSDGDAPWRMRRRGRAVRHHWLGALCGAPLGRDVWHSSRARACMPGAAGRRREKAHHSPRIAITCLAPSSS